ncbi:hypothetical protein OESDEN_22647 [Oesophagostomum dentatum]|uniref:Uncharacterized protein n=1 Tax=Oesophagostomum dentatum TaxID=61180 RepID=A0A0B1RYH9_OESDE|nr:hypothetical protein OESDEN_22647 [Oesophagostomum dentatum]
MQPIEGERLETKKSDEATTSSNAPGCPNSTLVTLEPGPSNDTTNSTGHLPQKALQEIAFASSRQSSADLYARFSKIESLIPPGSTKCENDVTSFIDNSVNFLCQIPEKKRADYLTSMEDWMQQKLSEGCSGR